MTRLVGDGDWNRVRTDIGRAVRRHLSARAEADDVVQDVLLRIWRNADAVREVDRFRGWIAAVVRSAIAEHTRAERRHPLASLAEAAKDSIAREDDDDDDVTKKSVAAALRPLAEALPERYRDALILSDLDGVPQSQIAVRLGISVSGVKSRVQRGRARLRRLLNECCEIGLDARRKVIHCRPRGGSVKTECCCD